MKYTGLYIISVTPQWAAGTVVRRADVYIWIVPAGLASCACLSWYDGQLSSSFPFSQSLSHNSPQR